MSGLPLKSTGLPMPWEGGEIVPIRWSALKVSEAADKIEELINQAAEPLEQARIVAREARKIPEPAPVYRAGTQLYPYRRN